MDDPTMDGAWGSYRLDDSGVDVAPVTLFTDGAVVRDIASSPGRNRRASWRHRPLARMSNTLATPAGKTDSLDDMLRAAGLIATGISGGHRRVPLPDGWLRS